MSFYTTLHFYRPTPPPVVTGPALARFLLALSGTGLFERKGAEYLIVKFGRSIDQDAKGTTVETQVVPGMYSVRSIEYDLKHDRISLADAVQVLSNHDRPVYRASVNLGILRQDVIAALQTERPDDRNTNLCLWDSTIELGPIELGSISSERSFAVGWMSVGFGDNGDLVPWTARDLTGRAMSLPQLEPLTRICRETFPVDPDYRGPGFRSGGTLRRLLQRPLSRFKRRRLMGDLWPFVELDRPWDWYWGVAESG
jgi:hypothetical protein